MSRRGCLLMRAEIASEDDDIAGSDTPSILHERRARPPSSSGVGAVIRLPVAVETAASEEAA